MNISGFRSQLQGGARPNQFRLLLSFPVAVVGGTDASRAGEYLVEATQLPGSTVGVANAMYRGRRIPLSGDMQFQPWTCTIVNDSGFTIRNAFENWMNMMNNYPDASGVLDPALYSSDINVQQLDRNDNVLYQYFLRSAWPNQVDPVNLSFADNDNLERFNVTFEYVNFDNPSVQ